LFDVVLIPDSADDDDDDVDGGQASVDAAELDLSELTRSLCLPSHILHLRHAEPDHSDANQQSPGGGVSVHSISTVLRGSQFGPFNCRVVDGLSASATDDSTAAGECHLEAS